MSLLDKILRRSLTYMKILLLKLRYGRRLSVHSPQRDWEKNTSIFIEGKDSSIAVGIHDHFRQMMTLRALNGGKIVFGSNCFCNSNVSITAMRAIHIGDGTKIANNVVIIDHDHDYHHNNTGYVSAPIRIGDNVWIGANVVILKGVTIGHHAVIAAGSVVNHDVPAYCVAAGVPARLIKEFHDEDET